MFQAQSDERINNLFADDSISEKALKILGTAPETVKTQYRNTAEAKEWIDQVVMPDLEISGIDPSEQAIIRAHLLDIADAKRHKTKDQLEEAMRKK